MAPARAKIVDVHASETSCEFRMVGATDAMANAIRRVLLRDIASAAISKARVSKNDTPFPDDMLAHRLGLVPLIGPVAGAPGLDDELPAFTLCKSGPCAVMSEDLLSVAGSLRPFAGIEICPLSAGQTLELKAWCDVGRGESHARFNQCVAPRYETRHPGVTHRECFCEPTPHGARCALCGFDKPPAARCIGALEHHFAFETNGGMHSEHMLRQALLVLLGKLTELRRACAPAAEASDAV